MQRKNTPFWVKVLIPLVILCCIATLVSQRAQLQQQQEQQVRLLDQAAQLTQQNSDLQQDIDAADTEAGIFQIARELLGLTQSGEIIFKNTEH